MNVKRSEAVGPSGNEFISGMNVSRREWIAQRDEERDRGMERIRERDIQDGQNKINIKTTLPQPRSGLSYTDVC